ncbi:MAG TPA: UvrD-helicase domain-containing protein [Chloroflexota bacterium]|nr:UvrD-helicase domain-containing protein [Chloroflexota bacterium]
MQFLIAETFTDSLAKLSGEDQKAAKTTAFDLQLDPASPGLSFHKLDRAKDKNFWSVRASADVRLIVHRTAGSLLLCYVGHHDDAYEWAERRRLETHPQTGAAQLVEVRERVEEIAIPRYVEAPAPAAPAQLPLFASIEDDELLRYGVPPEWLPDVRTATEDTLLELADHLPSEAAEALLDLATGATPKVVEPVLVPGDAFSHPDAQRRFRVIANSEELERALEYPWEKWSVFLHPAQRESVERSYGGPARISGSAGTGKTVVALHRAVFLARSNPQSRVLLTTFSEPLANALRTKLLRLIGNEPRVGERIDVYALDSIAKRLYELNLGPIELAPADAIPALIEAAAAQVPQQKFSGRFLSTEWTDVVDAWQLDAWEAYRDVARLGRKTRLPEAQRQAIWAVFERVWDELRFRNLQTIPSMYARLASHYAAGGRPPFDFVVVDEAQDLNVAQLKFLAALGADRPDALFFAGDLGQRIFQQPFSWRALGVDIRGRARTLRINYRTTHQIRRHADRLLGPEVADADGNVEIRRGTISVFNGPDPLISVLDARDAETAYVGKWLADRLAEGVKPHEVGVFVRSTGELHRAKSAVNGAGVVYTVLDEKVETRSGHVSIGTMHLAKGLEFRTVAVMACDDDVIPLQERIETVFDDADLEDVYNTERQLLYVACTRARDHLLVSATAPASEFLDDLGA